MKKIVFFCAALFLALAANAQFGIQAGGTITTLDYDSSGKAVDSRIKPGMFYGVTYDYQLANHMVINGAFNYKNAGSWERMKDDLLIVRLNYFNLDITYNYIMEVAGLELFGEGGGYAAVAISGKSLYKPDGGTATTSKIDIGRNNDDFVKAFDAGFRVGVGIYFGKIKLGAGFTQSIPNISPTANTTIRNKTGYLSATYIFDRGE